MDADKTFVFNPRLSALLNLRFFARRGDLCSTYHNTDRVGQVGNLRPIGNRPVNNSGINTRRITNPPQVTNLPHTIGTNCGEAALRSSAAIDPDEFFSKLFRPCYADSHEPYAIHLIHSVPEPEF